MGCHDWVCSGDGGAGFTWLPECSCAVSLMKDNGKAGSRVTAPQAREEGNAGHVGLALLVLLVLATGAGTGCRCEETLLREHLWVYPQAVTRASPLQDQVLTRLGDRAAEARLAQGLQLPWAHCGAAHQNTTSPICACRLCLEAAAIPHPSWGAGEAPECGALAWHWGPGKAREGQTIVQRKCSRCTGLAITPWAPTEGGASRGPATRPSGT